ncbi:MAG: hypothetical protein JSV45_09255 [Chromatiales bacterium]|nr:MAG: hypothetical protein JSV45_09255 [Chromatiales bacterium]
MTPLDELLDAAVHRIGQSVDIRPVALDPELAKPKSFLKVLDADHYNWEADKFRKLFAMRFRVKLPPLDQINMIFYPEPVYEAPIFLFFCLLTKRKVIGHLNVNCPFDDADYRARWVQPLHEILNQYPPFEAADRYPEWMKKYRRDCTIMGMFNQDRYKDLQRCAMEYLDYYMQQIDAADPVEDPGRLATIRAFHQRFVDDIRTQDKAQGMISKMIGKDKARRIFYEVTT